MFVDRAVVTFIAGNGGNGCVSFRREKFVPKGGPDGGDGGRGGDIILVSQNSKNSLIDFKFRNLVKSIRGQNGSGGKKTGKAGKDEILFVPAGTVIKTFPDEKTIFDFDREDLKFTIVRGGRGGRGNTRFKSPTRQAPRFSEPGGRGETIKVILELKLIAFAGIVGLPNAGKSTLISRVSSAKPKIASYPFTTLTPHLGVVYNDYDSLVIADIPGIIEGAHRGEGMGLDFLRHIERNRVLIFLVDISGQAPVPPLKTFEILRNELKSHKTSLAQKSFFVVGSKCDLLEPGNRDETDRLQSYCLDNQIDYLEISALTGLNLTAFKQKLFAYYYEQ